MERKRNNKNQMELLYEKFYRPLFLYALTFLDNEDEAKDVVQEVFATIWQQWHSHHDMNRPATTYLYTLVRNRCLDTLRHNRAHQNYAKLMLLTETFETPEDVSEYETRIQALNDVISQLPEPGKTILNCCYYKKMTYQQTADSLNLSIHVVRKNMLKVFKIIRESLKNAK